MKKFSIKKIAALIVLLIFLLPLFCFAESTKEKKRTRHPLIKRLKAKSTTGSIKKRMKTRRPLIKKLKAKSIIGENNQGYLQFISRDKTGEDVVAKENIDRKKIYETIAKQQGTTADMVGRLRGKKIVKRGRRGEYFMDKKDKWYRKR